MRAEVVTIEAPVFQLESPEAREAYGDMQQVRAAAYGANYGERFLPFDASDYVARHHVLHACAQGTRTPVAALKCVTLEACDRFGLEFPALRHFSGRSPRHVRHIEALLSAHRRERRPLLYLGSWGVRKEARQDRELMRTLMELAAALSADDSLLAPRTTVLGVMLEPRTVKYWSRVGCQPVHDGDGALPLIPHLGGDGQSLVLAAFETPGDWALECRQRHRAALEGRRLLTLPAPLTSAA